MKTELSVAERLIKIDEVLHICGLSRSSVYANIQKGDFPAQVKLSRKASAWLYSEVLAWVNARAANRAQLRMTETSSHRKR
jgi:prophage regulatory protein